MGESMTPNSGETVQNFVTQSKQTHVLLSTAFVYIRDGCGEYKKCKAILDSTSQASFITNNCATFLGLKRSKINIPVEGLNGATVTVGQQINTVMSSKNNEFVTDIEFLVVPKITDLTPSEQTDITNMQLPKGITLADPQFFEPSKIDILLGAKTFEILKQNQIRISKEILLQNTYFGYLVTGSVQSNSNKISCHLSVVGTHLDDTLRSFWEIKALPEKTLVDNKLKYCMEHFDATHTRDSNGRYVVQMPIIKDKVQLGSSKDLMVKGLNSTLIRLNRSPDVKKLYNDFYVDDVLSCAPDLETAIEIQPQLIGMMNAGGMHLYKWCSNSRHLLSKVSTDDQEYVVGNDDLIRNNIWWSGPDLLHSDVDFTNNWDCSNTDPLHMKELKPIMNTFVQSTQTTGKEPHLLETDQVMIRTN
ncbi:DUF1758 domain-containing protein [Trichonephila clavata]|uniref:DUF1758 domain-containing protein n=1 Tax=Trichonephila clavata TaxID=2740835 RepID=A0A8X6G8W8_TRICU|nr:DUF1758 domain-containing protein [Trichonephila clavata]